VHMASEGHPIVGDQVYAGRPRVPRGAAPELLECLRGFRRQALHAFRLRFVHPASGQQLQFEAPLPDDMRELIAALEEDCLEHADD